MEDKITEIEQSIRNVGEWTIFNSYLLQALLVERCGEKLTKKVVKQCQKATEEMMKEKNDENI